MKLYDCLGPNPQVVRMFLAELGVEMETVTVDIMSGENRQEPHLNTVSYTHLRAHET